MSQVIAPPQEPLTVSATRVRQVAIAGNPNCGKSTVFNALTGLRQHTGNWPGKTVTRGSIWIEIILWLCLIVPGLIYSIWRLTTRRQVCSACGAASASLSSKARRRLTKS